MVCAVIVLYIIWWEGFWVNELNCYLPDRRTDGPDGWTNTSASHTNSLHLLKNSVRPSSNVSHLPHASWLWNKLGMFAVMHTSIDRSIDRSMASGMSRSIYCRLKLTSLKLRIYSSVDPFIHWIRCYLLKNCLTFLWLKTKKNVYICKILLTRIFAIVV